MRRFAMIAVGAALFGALAVTTGMALDDDEKVTLEQVPPAVRAVIQQKAAGGTIQEIERETEDGKVIYSVEVLRDGKTVEFEVAADGTFLGFENDDETERPIALSQAPAAVQAAAQRLANGAPITAVTMETDDGVTTYEVDWSVGGVAHAAELSTAGDVLERETQVDPNTLPAAVLAKLRAKFPNATVKGAEATEVHYYEVTLVIGGKTREVGIAASGALMDDDDDEDDKDDD